MNSQGDLFVWGRNTNGMFDGEAGLFALDQHIAKPTLISGLKVKHVSLGPKCMLVQKVGQESVSLQGSLAPNQEMTDPELFFNDHIVTDFFCGIGRVSRRRVGRC